MNHQKRTQEEIILFTRYPQAGRVKTRLIPELGADGAAGIHRSMTEQILRKARQIADDSDSLLSVYYDGGSRQLMQEWLGSGISYHEQAGGDLGLRMMQAFRDAWRRGANSAILIGSDCPALDGELITDALQALQKKPLVLGPAADGGYYLIGATSMLAAETLSQLFTDIAWGTSDVFRATIERTRMAGVTPSILKELHDIDHPRDLAYFHHHPDPQ